MSSWCCWAARAAVRAAEICPLPTAARPASPPGRRSGARRPADRYMFVLTANAGKSALLQRLVNKHFRPDLPPTFAPGFGATRVRAACTSKSDGWRRYMGAAGFKKA